MLSVKRTCSLQTWWSKMYMLVGRDLRHVTTAPVIKNHWFRISIFWCKWLWASPNDNPWSPVTRPDYWCCRFVATLAGICYIVGLLCTQEPQVFSTVLVNCEVPFLVYIYISLLFLEDQVQVICFFSIFQRAKREVTRIPQESAS